MIKVIHLPSSVGGNPQGISRGLKCLGLKSKTIVVAQNKFNYPSDEVISNQTDSYLKREIKKFAALKYVFYCDVVFFNYGRGLYSLYPYHGNSILGTAFNIFEFLMARLEISLLKLNSVKIIVQFQGSDARQAKFCLDNFKVTYFSTEHITKENRILDILKSKNIKFLSKICSTMYALNPDLLHVMPNNTKFLPYSHISLLEWQPKYTQLEKRPLRIGHAPTNRSIKGTELILTALKRLRKEGFNFEMILIEGKTNDKVKKYYEKMDVLVDQLFVGWYGGLAVEAMALGKPVICYIRQTDLHFIPRKMREEMPIINTDPDTIYDKLKLILNMPREDLLIIAKQSRKYVETWHEPIKICSRLKNDIKDCLK